jgi:hypothetical protein
MLNKVCMLRPAAGTDPIAGNAPEVAADAELASESEAAAIAIAPTARPARSRRALTVLNISAAPFCREC